MKALVTGSCGLIGSACVRYLANEGWDIVGIDNDMRSDFFGPDGSTRRVGDALRKTLRTYRQLDIDIRNRTALQDAMREERPDFIVHTAAQPSHDRAAAIPFEDFEVNAVGTLNILVSARDTCRDAPVCFTSTNKVYGDRPNTIALRELPTRWDYADGRPGIDETMSIDDSLHSLFGASKLSADVLCQEFGRYFGMPVGIFRCGCLTGPQHAAVESHGFLAYLVQCAVEGREYIVFGHRGKQVRDQLHASDVAALFLDFFKAPRCGEVYNLGGGRANSISVLEAISALRSMGYPVRYCITDDVRKGDHICYISDTSKLAGDFPQWRIRHDIPQILDDLVSSHASTRKRLFAGA